MIKVSLLFAICDSIPNLEYHLSLWNAVILIQGSSVLKLKIPVKNETWRYSRNISFVTFVLEHVILHLPIVNEYITELQEIQVEWEQSIKNMLILNLRKLCQIVNNNLYAVYLNWRLAFFPQFSSCKLFYEVYHTNYRYSSHCQFLRKNIVKSVDWKISSCRRSIAMNCRYFVTLPGTKIQSSRISSKSMAQNRNILLATQIHDT